MTPGSKKKAVISLLLAFILCLSGCSRSEAPPIGQQELEEAVEQVCILSSRLEMFLVSLKKDLQDSEGIVMGEVIETYNTTTEDEEGNPIKYFVSRLRVEKVYEGDYEPGDIVTLHQVVEKHEQNELALCSVAEAGGYFEKGARLLFGIFCDEDINGYIYPSTVYPGTVLWLDEENKAIEKERPVLTDYYPLYKPDDWYSPLDEVYVTDFQSLEEYEAYLERYFQWKADGCPSDKDTVSSPESPE